MKKTILGIFPLLLASALLVTSCTKETTIEEKYNPNIGLYGFWKVIAAPNSTIKYAKFNSSKNLTVYTDASGFKGTINAPFTPYPDQFISGFGSGVAEIFNYRTNGDSLIVSNGSGEVFSAIKGTESDVNGWVTEVSVTDNIPGLFTEVNEGISFDGTNLLVADYDNAKIHSVSPGSKTIVGSLATVSYINTVEFDGTQYWGSQNGWDFLVRIKIADGSNLGTSVSIASWMSGLAYLSSTQLACCSYNTLYMYNPTTNALAFSKTIDGVSISELATYNGKIYATSGNKIYRIDPAGFVAEKTYSVNGVSDIYGIASVGGGDFWIASQSGALFSKVTLN